MSIMKNPTFFPARSNRYVPGMKYAAEVHVDGQYRMSFGAPKLAVATNILNAQSIAAAGNSTTVVTTALQDAPFGRAIQLVVDGIGVPTVTIDGEDYIGQPMSEVLVGNGATPVLGIKAFWRITKITWTAVAARAINVGTLDALGLPYKTVKVETEIAAGVVAAAGTLAAPVLTDPATTATGDARGTYTPTTALDGTAIIEIIAYADDFVNAAGNGGLHGIKQVAA